MVKFGPLALVTLGCLTLSACAARQPQPVQVAPAPAPAPVASPAQGPLQQNGAGDGARLAVVQDEASTEHRIGDYLSQFKSAKVRYDRKGADEWVVLEMSQENMPNYRVFIDSQSSGTSRRAPSQITERVILLRLFSNVKIPAPRRAAVMAALNHHHTKVWAGTFYVNEQDGEIEAQWPINITSADATVHPESVYDAWYRLCQSWVELFPQVAPLAFGGATEGEGVRQGI